MAQILFHLADGRTQQVEAVAGESIMRAAVAAGVPGIIGECGGQAMCATCHVYVRPEYADLLPEMSEDEDEMLDEATAPRIDCQSRLGCQIALGGKLEAIEVDVPEGLV